MDDQRSADDTAEQMVAVLAAARQRAAQHGRYARPNGSDRGRGRTPASLRHLAEVIQRDRLCTGMSVDKDIVAKTLAGDRRLLANPNVVLAVFRASALIERVEPDPAVEELLTAGSLRLATADRPPPEEDPSGTAPPDGSPPRARRPLVVGAVAVAVAVVAAGLAIAPRVAGEHESDCTVPSDGIIPATTTVFDDDGATRINPTLDFDAMNGSARYARHDGRTYYWGRAGSDDDNPHSGGARVRFRIGHGRWRSCSTVLTVAERGYVHTAAVATTINGKPVTIRVCLWRDNPKRENCTMELS